MSQVDIFLNQSAEWLKAAGEDCDIVVSSRLRLARNIEGYPFDQKLSGKQREEICRMADDSIKKSSWLKNAYVFLYSQLSDLDKQFLLERHLVSKEHIEEGGEKAVAVTPNEIISLMILEEDHLRLQAFQPGFNLLESWRIISQIDDQLEQLLRYAYSPMLGYLTACPTNVGTGLRASCMLHLPSLVLTKQVHKVLQALTKLNLAARGLYGEGTQATGNFFQISNQMTLGQPEEEIIDNLASVIRQVVGHEREARDFLKQKKKVKIEDQIWRSLGVLRSARLLASTEATQLLSLVQLGIHMGLIDSPLTQQDMNSLFLIIQPAHLQKKTGRSLNPAERDQKRADILREHLSKIKL